MVSGITPCARECKWIVYFGETPNDSCIVFVLVPRTAPCLPSSRVRTPTLAFQAAQSVSFLEMRPVPM